MLPHTSPSCPRAPTWVWHNRGMKHRAHLSTHQGDRLPCLGHCTFMVITRHHARGRGPLYHYVEPQWLHSTQLPRNAILPQACILLTPSSSPKVCNPQNPQDGIRSTCCLDCSGSCLHLPGAMVSWREVARSASYAGREQNTQPC